MIVIKFGFADGPDLVFGVFRGCHAFVYKLSTEKWLLYQVIERGLNQVD